MSILKEAYFYDNQLRKYILQFMAVFTGLQVSIGKTKTHTFTSTETQVCDDVVTTITPDVLEERLISVPIHYGHGDRVVASILAENTQNKPIRLPTLSAYMKNVDIAIDRMHGTGFERRNVYTPVGGLIPEDTKVVHQRMPVPYDMSMELGIYASNTDQHFQILEQILILFDPQLNIQKGDSLFDMSKLTHVKLEGVQTDSNYQIGTDKRIIQSTLNFTMPIWLSIPADVRRDFIEKIFMRVSAVGTSSTTNYDIIAELDQQGIPYQLTTTADDLPIQ